MLGLNQYKGLLAKKNESMPIVHNDDAIQNEYYDYHGVYYVNYGNIYNTLNRNIGGNTYFNQNYEILDEGSNLGQREGIIFDAANRPTPTFISDRERDSYTNYINYISNAYGVPSFLDSSVKDEPKRGYFVGIKRSFEIDGTSNPNSDNDTLLGKLSAKILSNIVFARNVRREKRGFTSITNINYYGKGRTDIEESDNIESLDSAIGLSSFEGRPEFGIKGEYAFIGFNEATLEYSYSSTTDTNYSLFDRWGEISNGTISLTNSPAYNSIKKSLTLETDMGTVYMSEHPVIDMSEYLIQNLKYKGNFNGADSFMTYLAKHDFNIEIEDYNAKNRYVIDTNGRDEDVPNHADYHYDEGALREDFGTANAGTNHGKYMVADNGGSYGKDLLYVTNNAFRNAKYDTIISKFCTQHQGRFDDKQSKFQSAVSRQFGMSHGRNLLKVNYKNGQAISVNKDGGNGYDNPYCRVWTYHHQYHRLCDTIRPFTKANDNYTDCDIKEIGENNRVRKEIAKYRRSTKTKDSQIYKSAGQEELVEYGVLNKFNGLVNITPTNGADDGDKKTKIENCMFSIENLAWKDIYKGSFRNISSGQTGPNGGRIMWFPPYGLTFNENVSANWNSVSFIGRGENVYTYTNTERSGNLSFMLLIDHPSVLNEWRKEKKDIVSQDVDDIESNEQKILRFFAGCEILQPLDKKEEPIKNPQTIELAPLLELTPPPRIDMPQDLIPVVENASESQNTEYTENEETGDITQINERSGDPSLDNETKDDGELSNVNVIAEDLSSRYDNEENFFKNLKLNDPVLHDRITDKIQYFDPAFHSITPEGFASRLTFLHQCTRQSNTIGASDMEVRTASNLSFGRPPVCILRIGDFYNTKIIIESINISYENGSGIQWDLNPEGVGVMPMYAKVDISFKFLGGSDLQGPISRLQNALSFNYYANTGVYDNRSDVYTDDNRTNLRPWYPTQPID